MVPKGWTRSQIGEIANIQVGRDLVEERYSDVPSDKFRYPVYSNTVEARGLYGFYDFPEYPGNAVTVVGRGIGLGTAFARMENESFGAIGRLLVLTPKNNSFDVGFLSDYFNFSLRIHNESGGIPQLPGATLSKYFVTLPPIPEQKKIAAILSTWDKAITTTEQLLANSQQQKKALMQQLLTGKKRLLDENGERFRGEWESQHLKKILQISKGSQLNRDTLSKYDLYPVINGGIEPSGYTSEYNSEANTITISEGGNSCGFVGFQSVRFWCGGHCYAIKNLKIDLKFAYQLLKFNQTKIMRLRVGSGLPNIQKKDLEALSVVYPASKDEQQKIAAVLIAADEKISALQQKIEALKQEKKALMQQLLTGKRRVKVDEVAA